MRHAAPEDGHSTSSTYTCKYDVLSIERRRMGLTVCLALTAARRLVLGYIHIPLGIPFYGIVQRADRACEIKCDHLLYI